MAAHPSKDRSGELPCSPQLLRIARAIAKYWAGKVSYPYLELRSVAYLGLSKALRGYDQERGQVLRNYVRLRIRAEIIEFLRAKSRRQRGDAEGGAAFAGWRTESWEETFIERRSAQQQLAPAMAGLSAREKQILHWLYTDELSGLEIAERLGLDSSRITQIHQGLLRKMRRRLESTPPAAEPETADAAFDAVVALLPEPQQTLLHMEQLGVRRATIARSLQVADTTITLRCRRAWAAYEQLRGNRGGTEQAGAAPAGHL